MSIQDTDAREQIERLVRSKTFETSEVHRRLLQYLADKTLAAEAERLKEYVIGLEAFGKPPEYDPKQDSIVRLQVGRLRQKLTAYYQAEGAEDPVVVSVPKGAFKLIFEEAEAATPAEAPPWRVPWMRRLLPVGLAIAVLWAVIATAWLVRLHSENSVIAERWNPELETLWAPLLDSKQPVLVCLGTPLFIRFPNFGFFRDPKANDWEDIEKSERVAGVRKALGDKEIIPNYHFTGSGEAGAAFLIAQLLSCRKRGLRLAAGNLISWQQIKDEDVVFIGPPKFNRQLQAAALTRDIVIEPDGIRNLKPKPGEPEFLPDRIVTGKSSEGETHALISRTPGLSGKADLLIIGGNASPDTFAAAEWLTDPARARELVRRLRTANGEIPRYFQAVIRVSFKQGVPVQSAYVFHHGL